MLSPHRQSVLTNACIKTSVNPLTRTPGTIYEPKGQVRLLGLLSESNPPQQEEYLDAGDGMLICMKRTKKRSQTPVKKVNWDLKKVPNVIETPDIEQELDRRSREQDMVECAVRSSSLSISAPNASPTPDCARESRSGSFPFQWMWESFSVKSYNDCSPVKVKNKNSIPILRTSVRDPPCTPVPSVVEQLVISVKDSNTPEEAKVSVAPCNSLEETKISVAPCNSLEETKISVAPCNSLEETKPMAPPDNILYKHEKYHQHIGLPPGSALLPLYWKMESRSENRKRQLRQERRRWLQLTQQLLNLENKAPRQQRYLSAKEVEEKLKAELLCLVTEPKEPGPPKEKSKAKCTKKEPTFQPTINQKIPNFKCLQKRFQEQLEHRKDQAKLTICKPFHIHSCQRFGEYAGDSFNDLYQLWRVHWRAQSCPNFDIPVGPPVTPTKASNKRQQANRLLLQEWEKRAQQEKRQAEQRRNKEQQVQQEVAKCLAAYRTLGHTPSSLQRRREELRRQEKQRMDEYYRQLQEIHNRVESRPYLFERVMQANARQAVERRFSQVLSALGIDEEMLWKHAVRHTVAKSSSRTL